MFKDYQMIHTFSKMIFVLCITASTVNSMDRDVDQNGNQQAPRHNQDQRMRRILNYNYMSRVDNAAINAVGSKKRRRQDDENNNNNIILQKRTRTQ